MPHPFGQTSHEEIRTAFVLEADDLDHGIEVPVWHLPMGFHENDLLDLLDALVVIERLPLSNARMCDWAADFRIAILAALGIEEDRP